jgi:SAM-dependent methyltransferase
VTGPPAAVWEAGDAYERYVGRWSRPVARELLAWLARPAGGAWVDVGCGTGALAQTVLAVAAPASVTGVDPSHGFVTTARGRLPGPEARFVVGDAHRLPLAAARFDAAVSGLVLNFVPDPAAAVAEMARVTRAGSLLAAYVWDYAGRMELMRRFWDVAAALDPAAAALDEGRRFGICRPGPLAGLFRGAGLVEVATRPIEVPTRFRDFDDYWAPFLGGQGPAPGYVMALDEGRRADLREALAARLPVAADGSIPMVARAWAVAGRRPGRVSGG